MLDYERQDFIRDDMKALNISEKEAITLCNKKTSRIIMFTIEDDLADMPANWIEDLLKKYSGILK